MLSSEAVIRTRTRKRGVQLELGIRTGPRYVVAGREELGWVVPKALPPLSFDPQQQQGGGDYRK